MMSRLQQYPLALFVAALIGATSALVAAGWSEPACGQDTAAATAPVLALAPACH